MKEKNLPLDYQHSSLEELTEKANSIVESLENEKNLNNSVDSYQELLKLNNFIEKKFQKNLKSISEMASDKIKEILKKNEKWNKQNCKRYKLFFKKIY